MDLQHGRAQPAALRNKAPRSTEGTLTPPPLAIKIKDSSDLPKGIMICGVMKEIVLVLVLVIGHCDGSKFVCPSSGFHPDPSSCTSFYRCVGSSAFRYKCPAGTIYDMNISNCNHIRLAPPCRIDNPNQIVELPAPTKKPDLISKPSETSKPTNILMGSTTNKPADISFSESNEPSTKPTNSNKPSGISSNKPEMISNQSSKPVKITTTRPVDISFSEPSEISTKPTNSNEPSGISTDNPGLITNESSKQTKNPLESTTVSNQPSEISSNKPTTISNIDSDAQANEPTKPSSNKPLGISSIKPADISTNEPTIISIHKPSEISTNRPKETLDVFQLFEILNNQGITISNTVASQILNKPSENPTDISDNDSSDSLNNKPTEISNDEIIWIPIIRPEEISELTITSSESSIPLSTTTQAPQTTEISVTTKHPNMNQNTDQEISQNTSLPTQKPLLDTNHVASSTVPSLFTTTDKSTISTSAQDDGHSTTKSPSISINPSTSPPKKEYTTAPGSLYPCKQPGYYVLEGSCTNFYMCQENLPGTLLADRLYRCPDRYLFDTSTQRCQRKHKVDCVESSGPVYYNVNYYFKLREDQLDKFFSTPLVLDTQSRNKHTNLLSTLVDDADRNSFVYNRPTVTYLAPTTSWWGNPHNRLQWRYQHPLFLY